MRRSECAYGCEKAQQAVQYAQDYAVAQGMDVNFTELLMALPPPAVAEESNGFLIANITSSSESTDVAGSMTTVSSTGQGARLSKQILSDTYFRNWKDRWVSLICTLAWFLTLERRWVFQANHRTVHRPGNL